MNRFILAALIAITSTFAVAAPSDNCATAIITSDGTPMAHKMLGLNMVIALSKNGYDIDLNKSKDDIQKMGRDFGKICIANIEYSFDDAAKVYIKKYGM